METHGGKLAYLVLTFMSFAQSHYGLPKFFGNLAAMSDGLERFASIVKRRREELGLRQDQLRDVGGPSTTTMTKVENAIDAPSPVTLRKLDAGLDWEPGSAYKALHGGEPIPIGKATGSADASYLAEHSNDLPELLMVLFWALDDLSEIADQKALDQADELHPVIERIRLAADALAVHSIGGEGRVWQMANGLADAVRMPTGSRPASLGEAVVQVVSALWALRHQPDGTSLRPPLSAQQIHEGDPFAGVFSASAPASDRPSGGERKPTSDNVRTLPRSQGRDFARDPIIEEPAAAYDPPGSADADEFTEVEDRDPEGPEGGA